MSAGPYEFRGGPAGQYFGDDDPGAQNARRLRVARLSAIMTPAEAGEYAGLPPDSSECQALNQALMYRDIAENDIGSGSYAMPPSWTDGRAARQAMHCDEVLELRERQLALLDQAGAQAWLDDHDPRDAHPSVSGALRWLRDHPTRNV